jgi:hypothetical protein
MQGAVGDAVLVIIVVGHEDAFPANSGNKARPVRAGLNGELQWIDLQY